MSSFIRSCDNALRFFGRFSSSTVTLPSFLAMMTPDRLMAWVRVDLKGVGYSASLTIWGKDALLLVIFFYLTPLQHVYKDRSHWVLRAPLSSSNVALLGTR